MKPPLYSSADYLSAFLHLLPRGRIWPRAPQSVLSKTAAGLVNSYAVQNARANYLLFDAFPKTAVELLPEWEATLGLPSAAAGPAPSIIARQLLVFARFVGPAGNSLQDYASYAALLGFAVSVHNAAPFRCGQSACGQSLGTQDQFFNVLFSMPGAAANATVFGIYGPAVLQAELQRIAPAHVVFNFQFT